MRNIVFIFLLLVANTVAMAGNNDPEATQTIKGRVLDESGEALAGVEVILEGTNTKVYTDFDGNFEIGHLRNGNYTVVFNFVSYKEKKTVLNTVQNQSSTVEVKLAKKKLF